MSVNYNKLVSLITDYLARDDISTTVIDSFIDVVEADIIATFQPRELDAFIELPVQEGNYIELPEDYRLSRVVKVGESAPLQQIDPQTFFENEFTSYITTIGDKMYFGKNVTGSTCKLLYTMRIPPLYDSKENAISKLYPALYTFGCLREASTYIDDKAKAEVYKAKYLEALEAAMVDADQAKYSGSTMQFIPTITISGGI